MIPKVGAVGSSDVAHNHVWIVVGVEGEKITIQEGNLNGKTDSFEVAKSDWHTVTYSLSQLRSIYGNISLYGFILLYLSGMVRDFVVEARFVYSYFILIKFT